MSGEEPGRFYRRLQIGSPRCALRDPNCSFDAGTAENLTFHEINDHLDRGNLVEHLQERLGRSFSTVRPEVEQGKLLIEGLRFVRDRAKGREFELFTVQNNEVCLLIAYITELIQKWELGLGFET